ncbi:MAG: hypothetical protein JW725_05265 [Candidatus Babeliaceae bacterium]|nr:hypothetical protein [Candidatus Babeliaceae bacterium]
MNFYGQQEQDGYPLAAWIWGHRMRIGQHWMEYLLEFLNVLAGFDYELGRKDEYKRFTRLGLRRFVFYDEREKTRHFSDDQAVKFLHRVFKEDYIAGPEPEETLQLVRTLLQAFSAIEEQRSWYAKSLFPAHHNLLFWEALRKSKKGQSNQNATEPRDFDTGVAFDARNFFARGGEIYYLILSAGTQDNQERCTKIANRLKSLLNDYNQGVGYLAALVDQAWHQQVAGNDDFADDDIHKTGRLGWIPDPNCQLYKIIAEDLETFLETHIDPLETLDLLAHLIGFHLTLYIYHRAQPNMPSQTHMQGNCLEAGRLILLVDALNGSDGGVIRQVSATLFQEQEARIIQAGKEYVSQFVRDHSDDTDVAWSYFGISRLSKDTRKSFEDKKHKLDAAYQRAEIALDKYLKRYAEILWNLLINDFRKNFLGVHRKLSKSVGFVAPKKGAGARFVLDDNILKALTLANVSKQEMTYDEFLARLYLRYGIVVGPIEARQSGLFERQRINVEYYDRNKIALLEKMKFAGLATEYSDATAMIGKSV